jgi:hypothetical protein
MRRALGVLFLMLAGASLAHADDPIVDAWQIDGDHAIVDGVLVLGGKRTTRAYLKSGVQRGFDIRFEYRLEGKDSAELGWDIRRDGRGIPGLGLRVLPPSADWREAHVHEFFDWSHLQRMIAHPGGANGVFGDIEAVWLEVPVGSKLYLRSAQPQESETAVWPWLVGGALSLLVGVLAVFVWRWKKRRTRT